MVTVAPVHTEAVVGPPAVGGVFIAYVTTLEVPGHSPATDRSRRYCVVTVILPGLYEADVSPAMAAQVVPPSVLDCQDQVSVPAGSSPDMFGGLKGDVQLEAGEPAVIVPGVLEDKVPHVRVTRP